MQAGVVAAAVGRNHLRGEQFDWAAGLRPLLFFAIACLAVVMAPLIPHIPKLIEWLVPAPWFVIAKAWKLQAMSTGGIVTVVVSAARAHKPALDAKLRSYLQRPDYAAKVSFLTDISWCTRRAQARRGGPMSCPSGRPE